MVNIDRDRIQIYNLLTYQENQRSLESKAPLLVKEWHPFKNGDLKPHMFSYASNKKVWWLCEKGHEWIASPNRRIQDVGCPYCAGQKVCKDNCLATLNPELAKEWHPTKNGSLTPKDVTAGSSCKNIWWLCKNGHEWQAKVSERNKGSGCPFCTNRKVCNDNCLQTLYPRLEKEWHYTKNGNLTPKNVLSGSHKKVWWKCKKEHEWQATIHHRINGTGCPYCSGKKVTKENSLAVSHPKLLNEWHPTKNNNVTPYTVSKGSNRKVWWICNKGHEFQSTIWNRANNTQCPYCINQKVCDDNCLATVNPELAKEWHPVKNGNLTPKEVTCGSGKKVWWICKKDHEWKALIYNRSKGSGCPICKSRK